MVLPKDSLTRIRQNERKKEIYKICGTNMVLKILQQEILLLL